MTTIETTTELLPNVEAAGVGGRIRHTLGIEYVIGQDNSGNWTGTYNGDTYDIDVLVKTGWSVVNSDSLGEFVEMQTCAEFFRTLNPGTILTMVDGRTLYVYVGQVRNDEGERIFQLVDLRWADALNISVDDAENENDWEAVETTNPENGLVTRETVDPNHFRAIETILSVRRDNRAYQKSLDEIAGKLERVMNDFRIVNDFLCEWAVDKDYCREFETVIGRWNEDLSELELLGRPRQFGINLRIAGMEDSPCFTYYHEARSESQAREHVSQLATRAILESMIENGSYFEGLQFIADEDD